MFSTTDRRFMWQTLSRFGTWQVCSSNVLKRSRSGRVFAGRLASRISITSLFTSTSRYCENTKSADGVVKIGGIKGKLELEIRREAIIRGIIMRIIRGIKKAIQKVNWKDHYPREKSPFLRFSCSSMELAGKRDFESQSRSSTCK